MSAVGDILVRQVEGGWIVSAGIESDGWFVTNPERVGEIVRTLLAGGTPVRVAVPDNRQAIDILHSIAGRVDRLTLSIADVEARQRAA